MSRQPGIGAQIVKDYLDRFPNAASRTLARKIYIENPAVWSREKSCLAAVCKARGQHGKKNREHSDDKSHFREPGDCRGFPALPEGITHLTDWQAVPLDTPAGHWAILSDIHAPYHDTAALRVVISEAKRLKIAGLLLNGDILDCFAVSRWEKDPRKRNFSAELQVAAELFAYMHHEFPRARIVWKFGNHEERYDSYMQTKAPELLDVADFDLPSIAGATKHGIEVVRDKRPIKLGKLWVLHGHEYRFAIQNPVNPARGLFLRSQVSAICGHFHQSSSHSEKNLAEHVTTCWSMGCLCDTRPDYMPLNKWNHGAAIVELGKDGSFAVENFRIIEGRKWS